jgi:hypothetical protein
MRVFFFAKISHPLLPHTDARQVPYRPPATAAALVPGRVTGQLAPVVAALPSLHFLALSGPLPAAFSPALRTIDLSKNTFSSRIPPSLLQLRGLRMLVLSHNAFAGEIPRSVTAPLVHLDLRCNRLSGGVPPLPGDDARREQGRKHKSDLF